MSDQIEEDENKEIERKEAEADTFGFDGLGTSEADYAVGKVVALAQAGDGAVLFLGLVCVTMDFSVFSVTYTFIGGFCRATYTISNSWDNDRLLV